MHMEGLLLCRNSFRFEDGTLRTPGPGRECRGTFYYLVEET